MEIFDNTRIDRRVPKTIEAARRLQDGPSEELRNARGKSERRSDAKTRNVRIEIKIRSNDKTHERQLESFDIKRINRKVVKTSEAGRINVETRVIRKETKIRSNGDTYG